MIESIIYMMIGGFIHALKEWQLYQLSFIDFIKLKWIDTITAIITAWIVILSDLQPVSPIYAFTVGYTSDSALRYIIDKYGHKG